MKNKILALTLIITILSIVPAFADTNSSCNNNNLKSNFDISKIYNYLSENCNIDISQLINNCTNQGQTADNQNIDIENLTQTLQNLVVK